MAGLTALTADFPSQRDADDAILALGLGSTAKLQELRAGVLLLLRRELGSSQLAEEFCNESFRIVLERLQKQPLEDPSRLAPYLAQTARYLVIAHQRKSERRQTVTGHGDAIVSVPDPAADPAERAHTDACARAVRRVLEEIPNVRDREILVRVYLHEQDKEQVCRELGIDEAHLRKVVFRAKERFKSLIEKRYQASDLLGFAIT